MRQAPVSRQRVARVAQADAVVAAEHRLAVERLREVHVRQAPRPVSEASGGSCRDEVGAVLVEQPGQHLDVLRQPEVVV